MRCMLGVIAIAFFLVSLCSALMSDEADEYCNGKGSICSASDDLDRTCDEKSGQDYYECLCESGWMAVKQACANCENVLGGFGIAPGAFYTSICSENSFTIAAMPSSISSAQSARNKTATIPSVTLSSSTSKRVTATTTPNYIDAFTTTIDGMTPVTLPPMATRTDEPSGASILSNHPFTLIVSLSVLVVFLL